MAEESLGEHGELRRLLQSAVAIDGAPRWIAHLVNGVQTCDSSDTNDVPSSNVARHEPCTRVARLASMLCLEQDRQLEPVQTGPLVRVVMVSGHGAIYCLPIVRGRHLLGVLDNDGSGHGRACCRPSDDRPCRWSPARNRSTQPEPGRHRASPGSAA